MLTDALTMARTQIGELVRSAAARRRRGGRQRPHVGALPLPSPVKLPARNREVVVRAPGYSERRELVPIAGGQRHALTVNLEKDQGAGARAGVIPATPPAPAPALSRRLRRPRR